MIFRETEIGGAFLIEPERQEDSRGFFARSFCREEFEAHGLMPTVAQCNISYSARRGTLRGMHYRMAPHEEAKLVRCTRGAIWDVVLDLRPDSLSFRRWCGAELSADNRLMVHVPEDCAHGYLTLEDECEVFYQMSKAYQPDAEGGVRYDDPAFTIHWPQPIQVVSERDSSYPDFQAP